MQFSFHRFVGERRNILTYRIIGRSNRGGKRNSEKAQGIHLVFWVRGSLKSLISKC